MTSAQVMESENGVEYCAALDSFISYLEGYNSEPTGTHLWEITDKLVGRMREFGLPVPETLSPL